MSNEKQSNEVSKEATLGMRLVQKTKELMLEELRERGELDEDWDLKVDKMVIEEEVLTSEEFYEVASKITDHFYDSLVDEVTYEKRQAESDRREQERTDKTAYDVEKSKVTNKINKKYN